MNKTLFVVDIKYPSNPYYPIEERVDEVRHEFLKILSKNAIYANKYKKNIKHTKKKKIVLITIALNEIDTIYYTLSFNLDKQSSVTFQYSKYVQTHFINFVESLQNYHKKNGIIKELSSGKNILHKFK